MNDPVGKVLEHLDHPMRPRREFEDALLRSCLASLAGAQPLPAAESVGVAVDPGGSGEAPPAMRTGVFGRWARRLHGSTHIRLRSVMVGIGTAALLGGLLGASLLLGQQGGPNGDEPGSRSGTAAQDLVTRYLDVLRADYPTVAADVERIGIHCVFVPSAPDLQQCRTYVLDVRTAALAMRDDLGASAVPPALAANARAIRRDLDDLVAGADVQLSSIAAGSLRCCPVDDANGHLHDDVFSALGVASPTGASTG